MAQLPGEVPFEKLMKNNENFRRMVWTGVGVALTLCAGGGAVAAAFFTGR